MRAIRRALQVVALVGTLMVGVVALALIVSQTPWFRDWLRRFIVRESKQYLNGELTIGGLSGNLFFGVGLDDVTVDVSGQRVVAIKGLTVDYTVFDLVSKGTRIQSIKIDSPQLRVERDAEGWNLARLVKRQQQEADRQGPRRAIALPSIELVNGSVTIDDRVGSTSYRLPRQIQNLQVKAGLEYAPVHYSIDIGNISFTGTAPDLTLQQLSGQLAVREDNLYLEKMSIRTGESALTVGGVIKQYLKTPVLELMSEGTASLPEIGRITPVLEGYPLTPTYSVKASGALNGLTMDLDVKSQAGNVRGPVTADFQAPDIGVKGEVDVERLNLAPILKNAEQKSDITGHSKLDIVIASAPQGAPALDRLSGTFAFNGPRVFASGYQAANVRATGNIAGPKITLNGRADAYGATATTSGFIVIPGERRLLALDLKGAARNVDLRRLPRQVTAPQLDSSISASEYHVTIAARRINATATLEQSTVEGATIAAGTKGEFASDRGVVSYAAHGSADGLNLQRIGHAFQIAALDKPEYDSALNSTFDVRGTGSALETMTLDATGTLTDSTLMGAHMPQMAYEAHLRDAALDGVAKGRFEHLDPAQIANREEVKGDVTGTVDARFRLADLTAPITAESVTADGTVLLEPSTVGQVNLDSATVRGRYVNQVADIDELAMSGPDAQVDAKGRLALDRTSASNLEYHIDAKDLTSLAKLAGQEGVAGTAVLDGTLTGNAASLQTTGKLNGNNLAFESNSALQVSSSYTATIPDLQFANAEVKATTDATFVKVGGTELNEVKATTTYHDKTLAFDTNVQQGERALDAKGDVVFHPDHQEIHLPELALRTQGVEWRTTSAQAAIRYGQNQVELVDVKLASGDQSIDASGTIALEGAAALGTLSVHARNVDIAEAQRLALVDRGLTGRLTADATITGMVASPEVSGTAEINGGGFRDYRYDKLTAKVDYQGTQIGINATLQQSPTEALTVNGTVPTTLFQRSPGVHVAPSPGNEVNLHVSSTPIGLGIIQGFTTAVTQVAGTVQVDVTVTGSGQDPHLEGLIDIRGGAFGVPATGVSYTGLDTTLALSPDRIAFPTLKIIDEEGEQLTISGSLGIHERQAGAVDVKIASRNFEIIDNELGDVGVETDLTVTGQIRRPKIVGSVKLQAARLEVDKILALFYDPYSVTAIPDVVSAERDAEATGSAEEATKKALTQAEANAAPPGAENADLTPPPPGGAFAPVELDVKLRIPENLVLRGKDLRPGGPTGAALGNINMTVGGDVELTKAPDGPVIILGSVDTVRGTYEFQGRRFDLVRGGTARFTGETQINPILDISATRDIPNTGVQARVHITGTVKAPELQLTSTPPLDESDILALIVFNRPVNELGTGERTSLAATAGGIAGGFIASPLGESIGRALDLDQFEITTTNDSGELGAGLTVGQQVGDRAFLRLRQQFGAYNSTEFQLEYQLADFLRVQASGAPETSGSANRIGQRRVEAAGIDLIFFFSY